MGKQTRQHRTRKPSKKIRNIKRPKGYDGFNFMIILIPEYCDNNSENIHGEIIGVVRNWGLKTRIRSERRVFAKQYSQFTKIFLTDEASFIMLKACYPNNIWKIFAFEDENKV